MLFVAIATKSMEKIEGIKEAISRFFQIKSDELEIVSKTVDSMVPEQPFAEEVYQGALNRVNAIRSLLPEMDYYISCEAGIEYTFGQYFNVQVVCLYDNRNDSFLWGKSAGWSVPSEDIEIIRQDNLDKYLRGKGITCIEELLGASHSRRAAVAQATEFALASGKIKNN